MRILVFDNYDSFTYNLVHIIRELGYDKHMDICRNDKMRLEEIGNYDKILLSPGPGLPKDAGTMEQLIEEYAPYKSILGICLGHQGISEVFGAELYNMPIVLHGITTPVNIILKNEILFEGLPEKFNACRYHSWAVVTESVNSDLEITAVDEEGVIMGIRHSKYDVRGLQFHPEAYLTEHGIKMMENWLKS
jgi:anthranilate synthase component 2